MLQVVMMIWGQGNQCLESSSAVITHDCVVISMTGLPLASAPPAWLTAPFCCGGNYADNYSKWQHGVDVVTHLATLSIAH